MAHSITVGIRMRPMVEHEAGQNPCFELTEPSDVDILSGAAHHVNQPKGFEGPWRFDHAMDSSSHKASPALFSDNSTCYEKMGKPMLEQALEGYNVCLFCYGQTGSGKTTTIMGDAVNGEGVLVRLLRDLFGEMDALRGQGATCDVSMQMLEVYNETVHDLLQVNREEMLKTKVNVHLLPRGVTVQGATSKAVETVDECMKYIEHANRLKTMHPTLMNPQSSRGHVIFKLYFHKSGGEDGMLLDSEIYFADLAGHENEKTTKVTGDRFKELTFINKSLMWLQQAIHGLATASGQKDHADMHMFRNSKLTMILSPALTGNSRTAIIVTLSPAAAYFDTSIASLKFAVEAKSIKIEAKAHKSADPYVHIKELEAEIMELKAEARAMRERLAHYEAGGEILPPLQFAERSERPPSSPRNLGEPPSSPRTVGGPPSSPKSVGGPPASPKLGPQQPEPSGGGGPPLSPRERRGGPPGAAAGAASGEGTATGEAEAPADKQPGSASTPARNTGQRRGGSAQAQAPQGKAAPKKSSSGTVPPGGARRGSAAQAQGKAASRRPNNTTPSAQRPGAGGAEKPAPAEQPSNASEGSLVIPVVPDAAAVAVTTSPENSLIEPSPPNGAGTDVPTGAAAPECQKRISGLLEALQLEVQQAFVQLAVLNGEQEKIISSQTDVVLLQSSEKRGPSSQAEGSELDGRMQSLQTSMQGLEEQLGNLTEKMTILQDTFSAKAGEQGGSAGTNSLPWLQQDNSNVQLTAQSPGALARQHHPADQKVEGVHLGSPDHCEAAAHPHYVCAAGPAAALHPQPIMPQPAGMPQPIPNWSAAGQRGRFQVAAVPQGVSREWTPRGDRAACVAAAQYPCRAPDLHHGGSHRAGSRFGVEGPHAHVVVRRLSPVTRGIGMDAAHHRSQQFYPHVSPPHFPQRQESYPAVPVALPTAPVSPVRHHSVIRASTGSAAERASADNSPAVSRRYLRIALAGETSQSEMDIEPQ